jgi:hypothetical protein
MYRAVVLTTLVLLLLAVAGVSVAQDGRIFAGEPNSNGPPESTTPDRTFLEASGSEETTTSPPPGASSVEEDRQNIPEPTVVTEPTVVEPEKPAAAPTREETPTPGTNAVGNPGDGGMGVGKPEHAGKAPDPAAGTAEIGQQGNGEPVERGNEAELGRSDSQQKVTLCHKGNKTLTVGAPALDAHQRHGDYPGACQADGAGPEPSGEARGPEAAKSRGGGSGGQDKVTLCHKDKNTLTVGAPAQEAHLRHGDILGACR